MFILHVDLNVKVGFADALRRAYRDRFLPTISRQPGFREAKLLRARSCEPSIYRLEIAFENEDFQRQWGETDDHREAWSSMEHHVSRFSIDLFDSEDPPPLKTS